MKPYSIDKLDEIDIEDVKQMLIEKSKINKYQKKINDKIVIQSGPYGYYIRYNNKTNYSIKFNNDFDEQDKINYIEKLKICDCNKIIEIAKSNKGKIGKNIEKIEKDKKTEKNEKKTEKKEELPQHGKSSS